LQTEATNSPSPASSSGAASISTTTNTLAHNNSGNDNNNNTTTSASLLNNESAMLNSMANLVNNFAITNNGVQMSGASSLPAFSESVQAQIALLSILGLTNPLQWNPSLNIEH